jgi:hypothetical protein
MQQTEEQCARPLAGSREPTHCTNASDSGDFPSLGRTGLPEVGEPAASIRSNFTPESTFL